MWICVFCSEQETVCRRFFNSGNKEDLFFFSAQQSKLVCVRGLFRSLLGNIFSGERNFLYSNFRIYSKADLQRDKIPCIDLRIFEYLACALVFVCICIALLYFRKEKKPAGISKRYEIISNPLEKNFTGILSFAFLYAAFYSGNLCTCYGSPYCRCIFL